MLHALRVNFENFGHTTKNTIFRLVKLLADLSTRLKKLYLSSRLYNTFSSQKLVSKLLFAEGAIVTRFLPR